MNSRNMHPQDEKIPTENLLNTNDTILITGATGFTGRHLIRKLCATGATIRAIARNSSNIDELQDLPIQWYRGDVFDDALVQQACEGVTAIFHVAAAFREAKVGDEVYWNVHVKSTQLLADAALRQMNKGVDFKRFVHVSTAGVHGHIDHPPADETYRFSPGDEYQDTKAEGEKWICAFAESTSLPVTVIRPCAIYGPGDRRLLKLFKLAKLSVCPLIGFNTQGLYHLIHVEDLTRFMITACTHTNTVGQIYIVGNETASSIRQIIQTIARHTHRTPRFLRLPATPFFVAGAACEALCKPLGVEPPIYRRRVAFFTKDRSFNTQKMRQDTGYRYVYDNTQGLESLADWYEEQGWI